MGIMEYADGKMRIRKELEMPDKSHLIEELEEGMKKKSREV